ncbi:hypothetical protein JOF56_008405 [Kibdelosporangium banguiense]|uniref:Uncharacterized protein n=1 Tax=Kibdelosporangium banguiense TaxID=1365924 RepID=A0ABS4TUE0_9PSEU|nr:hypothetical protein [Kibdelosporangium banguiense]MBP2328020.1 hypothetical protein [Kibdelosporangium banguiense]
MTNTEAAVAAAHDLSLPYLAGLTDTRIATLDSLPDGAHVVDIACGTGEPKRVPGAVRQLPRAGGLPHDHSRAVGRAHDLRIAARCGTVTGWVSPAERALYSSG